MRALSACAWLALLLLAGCPGSVIELLPPGSGPGVYAGQFTSEADDSSLGTLSLTIADMGAVTGNGLLQGRSVEITGVLTGDTLDGLITDTLSQFSGRFDGQLAGAQLSGDFRLPRQDDDDLIGLWDAALQ
jgi:uncharacterized protein YceK